LWKVRGGATSERKHMGVRKGKFWQKKKGRKGVWKKGILRRR